MDTSYSCDMELKPGTEESTVVSCENDETPQINDPDNSTATESPKVEIDNSNEYLQTQSSNTSEESPQTVTTLDAACLDNKTEVLQTTENLENDEITETSIDEDNDVSKFSNVESCTAETNENDDDSYEDSESDSSSSDESSENEDQENGPIVEERLKELEKYSSPAQLPDPAISLNNYNPHSDYRPVYKTDSDNQNCQTICSPTTLNSDTNQNPLVPMEVKTSDADSTGLDDVLNKYHSKNGLMDTYQNSTMQPRFYPQQTHPHYYSADNVNLTHSTHMAPNSKYLPYYGDYDPSGNPSAQCAEYPCQECSHVVFDKKSLLKAHMKTMHPHLEDKKFKCKLCPYASHYQKNLEKHLETFHNENGPLFHCDLCSKKFTNELHFNEHKSFHTVDNTHACHHCGKQFKTKLKLKYHMDVHNPKKQYKCDYSGCDRAFSTPKYLNNHRNEFHGLQPKQLECPIENCGEVFQRKSHLNRHMSVHGENCFRCPFPGCNRSFRNQETLQHHQFKHSGQKPFHCDLCDFSCRQRGVLNNHYRDIHSKENYHIQSPIYKSTDPCTPENVRNIQRSLSMPVNNNGMLSPCKPTSGPPPSNMRCHTGDVYAFTEFDPHASLASRYHNLHNDSDLPYNRAVSQGGQILKMKIDNLVEDVLNRKHINLYEAEPLSEQEIDLAESILENTLSRLNTESKEPQSGSLVIPNQMKDLHSDYSTDFKMEDIASLSQFDDVFAEVAPEMFNGAFSESRDLEGCGNSRSPASCSYFQERMSHAENSEDQCKSSSNRTSLPRLGNLLEENLSFGSEFDSDNKSNSRIALQSRESDGLNIGGVASVSSDQAMRVTPRSTNDNVDLLDEVLQDLKELEEKQRKEKNNSLDNTSFSAQSSINSGPADSSGIVMTSGSSSNSCALNGLNATPANTTPESQWSDSDYSFGRDSVGGGSKEACPSAASAATPSNQSSVGSSDSQYQSSGYGSGTATQYYSPVKSATNSFASFDPNSQLTRQVSYPGESGRSQQTNPFNRQLSSADHLRSLTAIGQNPYGAGSTGAAYDRSSNSQNLHSWPNGNLSHSNMYSTMPVESSPLNRQLSTGSYSSSQSVQPQTPTQEFVSPNGAPPQSYPPGHADYMNACRSGSMPHQLQRHNSMLSQNKLEGYPVPDYHSMQSGPNMMNTGSNMDSVYSGMYVSRDGNGYPTNRMPHHMDANFPQKQLSSGYRPYMFDGKGNVCAAPSSAQMQSAYPQGMRYNQTGYMLSGGGVGGNPSSLTNAAMTYPGSAPPPGVVNSHSGYMNDAAMYRSQMAAVQASSAGGGPPFNPVQGRYAFPSRY